MGCNNRDSSSHRWRRNNYVVKWKWILLCDRWGLENIHHHLSTQNSKIRSGSSSRPTTTNSFNDKVFVNGQLNQCCPSILHNLRIHIPYDVTTNIICHWWLYPLVHDDSVVCRFTHVSECACVCVYLPAGKRRIDDKNFALLSLSHSLSWMIKNCRFNFLLLSMSCFLRLNLWSYAIVYTCDFISIYYLWPPLSFCPSPQTTVHFSFTRTKWHRQPIKEEEEDEPHHEVSSIGMYFKAPKFTFQYKLSPLLSIHSTRSGK